MSLQLSLQNQPGHSVLTPALTKTSHCPAGEEQQEGACIWQKEELPCSQHHFLQGHPQRTEGWTADGLGADALKPALLTLSSDFSEWTLGQAQAEEPSR